MTAAPSDPAETRGIDAGPLLKNRFVRSRQLIVEASDDTSVVVAHSGTAARLKLSRGLHRLLSAFDRPETIETALGAPPDERTLETVRLLIGKGFLREADAPEAPAALRRTSAVAHKLFNCPPQTAGQAAPDISVLGVPYDLGAPGAHGSREAPSAIRQRSLDFSYVRDFATGRPAGWFDADRQLRILEGISFADYGDVFVDYGEAQAAFFERLGGVIDTILDSGSVPLVLGGDPSVSWPVTERLQRRSELSLLRLGACTGFSPTAPSGPANAAGIATRLCELDGVHRLLHVGCRGYREEEPDELYVPDRVKISSVTDYRRRGLEASLAALPESVPVYIDLDMNVLDPPCVPGACEPVPGGFDLGELKSILHAVAASRELAGLGIAGLSPDRDHNFITSITVCHLILATLGAAFARRESSG